MENFLLSFFLIDLSDLEVIWHRSFILLTIAQRHRVGPRKEGCLARVHLAAAWRAAASGEHSGTAYGRSWPEAPVRSAGFGNLEPLMQGQTQREKRRLHYCIYVYTIKCDYQLRLSKERKECTRAGHPV